MHSKTLQAFHLEMRKMAEESEPSKSKEKLKPSSKDWEVSQNAQLGALGGTLAAKGLSMALMKGNKHLSTPESMLAHINRIASEMGIPKDFLANMPSGSEKGGWSPSYFQNAIEEGTEKHLGHMVNLPLGSSDSTIAHELGHMKSDMLASPKLGKLSDVLQSISRGVSPWAAIPTSFVAATDKEMSYAPGVIQAILSSPMVVDEMAASARATAHLIREHGTGKGILKSLPLAPAMATYLALAGTPTLVTYLRRRAAKKEAELAGKSTQKEKTSEKDEDGLNFFERHPKKIIGGGLAALGTGAYLLSRGKKAPAVKLPAAAQSVPKATTTAPKTPAPKAPARRLTHDEILEARKAPGQAHAYPGYGPRPVDPTKRADEAIIHAAREHGIRAGMPEKEHRRVMTTADVATWVARNKKP